MHLSSSIADLKSVTGDTDYTYSDLTSAVTITVNVRVTSSKSNLGSVYKSSYIETSPSTAFSALTLNKMYPLTVSAPYITIMLYSTGGQTSYTLEYGRVDERDFSGATQLLKTVSFIVAFVGIYLLNLL